VTQTVFQKLKAMTPSERTDLYVWLLALAESNAIEGEHETADLTHFHAECVRQFPIVPKMERRYSEASYQEDRP
jgi:hypothetical protein